MKTNYLGGRDGFGHANALPFGIEVRPTLKWGDLQSYLHSSSIAFVVCARKACNLPLPYLYIRGHHILLRPHLLGAASFVCIRDSLVQCRHWVRSCLVRRSQIGGIPSKMLAPGLGWHARACWRFSAPSGTQSLLALSCWRRYLRLKCGQRWSLSIVRQRPRPAVRATPA